MARSARSERQGLGVILLDVVDHELDAVPRRLLGGRDLGGRVEEQRAEEFVADGQGHPLAARRREGPRVRRVLQIAHRVGLDEFHRFERMREGGGRSGRLVEARHVKAQVAALCGREAFFRPVREAREGQHEADRLQLSEPGDEGTMRGVVDQHAAEHREVGERALEDHFALVAHRNIADAQEGIGDDPVRARRVFVRPFEQHRVDEKRQRVDGEIEGRHVPGRGNHRLIQHNRAQEPLTHCRSPAGL